MSRAVVETYSVVVLMGMLRHNKSKSQPDPSVRSFLMAQSRQRHEDFTKSSLVLWDYSHQHSKHYVIFT